MKRIYLIGAALILFLFLGMNYFANRPATETNSDAAQTAGNGFAEVMSPIDNSQITPVHDNAIYTEQPACASACTAAKRPGRSHSSKTSSVYADKGSSSGAVENVKLVSYVQDKDVSAETSKDYSGNTPKMTRVIRIRHANNEKSYRAYKIFNGRVGFGPEIGFNQNGVTNSPSNMHTGSVHVGLIFNFKLGDNVAFQPGLRYITKGTKSMNMMDVNANEKLTTHYLELPADLVFKFGNPNNARFMAGAGPYVSYLLSARDRYSADNGGYIDVIGAQPAYNTANINKLDYGVGAFIGCTTPEGIYAKAGAELGLRDIQQNYMSTNTSRNYNFLLSVGYILGGNKK